MIGRPPGCAWAAGPGGPCGRIPPGARRPARPADGITAPSPQNRPQTWPAANSPAPRYKHASRWADCVRADRPAGAFDHPTLRTQGRQTATEKIHTHTEALVDRTEVIGRSAGSLRAHGPGKWTRSGPGLSRERFFLSPTAVLFLPSFVLHMAPGTSLCEYPRALGQLRHFYFSWRKIEDRP